MTSSNQTILMLNQAYQTSQEMYNEGHALLDKVGCNNDNNDSMMGDETAHKKHAVPDSVGSGRKGD
jgi:hypothetical protein